MATAFCRIRGRMLAETPLHIGSGARTGVVKHTRLFVPGSFLRGSFGTSLFKLEGESDLYNSAFAEEFGKASDIFFRHAYPLHDGCGGVFLPASRTLFKCVRCKTIYDTFDPPYSCEKHGCGGTIKPVSGFRCSKCGGLADQPVPIGRFTLTGIDRERLSYAEVGGAGERAGTLHVLEKIDEGAAFDLEVIISASRAADLEKIRSVLTKCVPDEGIGGSSSRGLGKVGFVDVVSEEVSDESLRRRSDDIDVESFSIHLKSPMILGEKTFLRPQTLLEGCRRAYTWCFHDDKPQLPDVALEKKRESVVMVSGWSLKSGKRRRVEPAISGGSAYLFGSKEKSATLAESLAALEFSAIGGYKTRGFGQVSARSWR